MYAAGALPHPISPFERVICQFKLQFCDALRILQQNQIMALESAAAEQTLLRFCSSSSSTSSLAISSCSFACNSPCEGSHLSSSSHHASCPALLTPHADVAILAPELQVMSRDCSCACARTLTTTALRIALHTLTTTALHCTALHCIALHTLTTTALHCIALAVV